MSKNQNSTDHQSIIKKIDNINARIWDMSGNDLEKELSELTIARNLAGEIDYSKGIAESLLNEGWCRSCFDEQKKSFALFQEAGELFEKIGDVEGHLKTINAIGQLYIDISLYEHALDHFSIGLKIAREEGIVDRITAFIGNIGHAYYKLKRYDDALKYNSDVYVLSKKTGNQQHLAIIYYYRGSIYLKLGKTDKALKYLFRSGEISKKINNYNDYLGSLNLVCEAYLSVGNPDRAELYIKKCKESARKKKMRVLEITAYVNSGFLQLYKSNYPGAVKEFKYAYNLSLELNHKLLLERIYKGLYKTYKLSDDLRSAISIKEEHDAYNEQIFSSETQTKIGILSTEFRLKQSAQEKEIYELRHIKLKKKNMELEKAYQAVARISTIGQEIISTLDIEEAVNKLYANVSKLMDASILGLAVYNKESGIIDFRVLIDKNERINNYSVSMDEEFSFAAQCIRDNNVIVVNNISSTVDKSKHFFFQSSTGTDAESLIYIPLVTDKGIIGVLTVQSYNRDSYKDHHVELLKALGSYLASAMENFIQHEKLQKLNHLLAREKHDLLDANEKIKFLANHDALTGLPNRRLFMELLEQNIKVCKRNKTSLSLFFMDLNHFKKINDTYGHETGDLVLKHASLSFRKVLREEDIVARFGGDEFIVLCPGLTEKKVSENIALKIIKGLGKKTNIQNHPFHIGVSIGIAIYPNDATTTSDMIKKADQAMYLAKNNPEMDLHFYENAGTA